MTPAMRFQYAGSFRQGEVALAARPRGAFVIATQPGNPRMRMHLVGTAATIWRTGEFVKFAATSRCGHFFNSAYILSQPPENRELCDDCVFADHRMYCVYRFFDADERLLYLGVTRNLLQRITSHKHSPGGRVWWPMVRRATYVEYPDKQAALAAEMIAILNERPLYNVEFTDRARVPGRRRSAFAHLIHAIPTSQSP